MSRFFGLCSSQLNSTFEVFSLESRDKWTNFQKKKKLFGVDFVNCRWVLGWLKVRQTVKTSRQGRFTVKHCVCLWERIEIFRAKCLNHYSVTWSLNEHQESILWWIFKPCVLESAKVWTACQFGLGESAWNQNLSSLRHSWSGIRGEPSKVLRNRTPKPSECFLGSEVRYLFVDRVNRNLEVSLDQRYREA